MRLLRFDIVVIILDLNSMIELQSTYYKMFIL